ncbi:MAG: LUD domain-containing protein [Capnocytophaga sp.]|nr:LUD domain-containing protein [Capnocytophaga sp.]
MNPIRYIKGIFKKSERPEEDYRSKYTPDKESVLVDELFAIKFTQNGGKFIYCESDAERQQAFVSILKELGISTKIGFSDIQLKDIFDEYEHLFTQSLDAANVFMTDCEYLISNEGSILLSSNQLKQMTITQLPEIFIVCASTSQMVIDISEAMRSINAKYKKRKPSGITAIKNFGVNQDDFRNYGSCPKKMYLILKEDIN